MSNGKFNILFIEENSGDHYLVQEGFRLLNINVTLTWVRTAQEAFYYIQTFCEPAEPPDLILSEIRVPGAEVCELLEVIKHHKILSGLPFVIFTNNEYSEDILLCQRLGAASIYNKPLDFNQYIETLRNIFEIVVSDLNNGLSKSLQNRQTH